MKIKENDVFGFRYKSDVVEKAFGNIYHCFDGQLVATKKRDGSLMLVDTYWTTGNRSFTIDEAKEKGELTFKCNLDEVEDIEGHDQKYYDDEDIINLSHQHGCYRRYAIKKGTKRSKDKMVRVLETEISDSKHKIKWAERNIETAKEKLKELESGNTDIYI